MTDSLRAEWLATRRFTEKLREETGLSNSEVHEFGYLFAVGCIEVTSDGDLYLQVSDGDWLDENTPENLERLTDLLWENFAKYEYAAQKSEGLHRKPVTGS